MRIRTAFLFSVALSLPLVALADPVSDLLNAIRPPGTFQSASQSAALPATSSPSALDPAAIKTLQDQIVQVQTALTGFAATRASRQSAVATTSTSTTTTTSIVLSRTLSYGLRGDDVAALQTFLKGLRYLTYPTITGYFGPLTWKAVASFQGDNGLPSIGVVGPKTRALIARLTLAPAPRPTNFATSSPPVTASSTAKIAATSTFTCAEGVGYCSSNPYSPGYGGGGGGSVSVGAGIPAPAQLGFSVGVNLSGLADGSVFPGTVGTDYGLPTHSEIDYYYSKGITRLRLPFRWERVQTTLSGTLNATYLGYIQDIVNYAATKGMLVILDPHNFGGYNSNKLGDGTLTNAQFADLWTRLATAFASDGGVHVAYDLMNEPSNMPNASAWPSAAQAAITAIRAVDTHTDIYIEGDGYSSAYQWVTNNPTLQSLSDPSNKLVFSAHTYPDRDNSGSHFVWATEVAAGDQLDGGAPLTTNILVKRLTPFVNWLQTYGLRGQIGELGVSNQDPNWLTTMDNAYAYLQTNGIPLDQWAGGPRWGTYPQSVEPGQWLTGYPSTVPTSDTVQMAVMTKYSGGAQPSVYFLTGPQTGTQSSASTNFTVAYRGDLSVPVTVTPSDAGAGGTFTPSSVTLASGTFNPTATFTYTAPSASTFTISVTNSAGLTNPASIGYSTIADRFSGESATPTLIFSLRRIFSPYTGPLVRLNRDSDNAQSDFGQLADGGLDRQSILNWAQGSSVRLVTGYDQSNRAANMTTVTYGGNVGGSTPRDYPAFILNDADGHPTIYFDGRRRMDSANSINGLSAQTWILDAKHVSGSRALAWEFSYPHNFPDGSTPAKWATNEDSPTALNIGGDTSWHEYAGRWVGATTNGKQSFKDGTMISQQTTTAATLTSNVFDMLHIGWFVFGGSIGSAAWTGYMREVVTFSGAASSTTISGISSDTNTYNATPLPALTPLADAAPYSAPTGWPTLSTKLKGINLASAESNSGIWKTYGYDYLYPTNQEIDYYASKGFGLIRLPFDICRVYETASSSLNMIEMAHIKAVVDYAGTKGMNVLLDPHNFGYMCDSRISNAANNSLIGVTSGSTALFADFWTRMANLWKNYPNVLFGLMNEPNAQSAAQWQAAASTTIAAIRTAGFIGKITIPGTSYTGAESWVSSGNGAAWAGYVDPGNNFVFEMHEYLDSDNSGTHTTCASGKGATALVAATNWLTANGYKALLGEFGWTTDTSCTAEGSNLVGYMSSSSAQWAGWTWWTSGPFYGSYMFNLDPADFSNPVDKAQMATLLGNL